jgi:hypothetical protein
MIPEALLYQENPSTLQRDKAELLRYEAPKNSTNIEREVERLAKQITEEEFD